MSKAQETLIQDYASAAAKRIAEGTMYLLMQSPHTLSGEDSGLTNTWEEICVQVQGGETYYWEAYESAMHDAVLSAMMALENRDMAAIWLQTQQGKEWQQLVEGAEVGSVLQKLGVVNSSIPVEEESVSSYIISQYLNPLAFDYSNDNIKAFLNPDCLDIE